MLWLHKDGGMYFFLFGKLSQYLAEEIHTRRRRLPTEENREEFKLGFHVCLISSLESLSAYMRTFFNDQSTKLAFGAIPTHPLWTHLFVSRCGYWLTNRSNFHGQNKPKLMFLLMKVLPVWFVCLKDHETLLCRAGSSKLGDISLSQLLVIIFQKHNLPCNCRLMFWNIHYIKDGWPYHLIRSYDPPPKKKNNNNNSNNDNDNNDN